MRNSQHLQQGKGIRFVIPYDTSFYSKDYTLYLCTFIIKITYNSDSWGLTLWDRYSKTRGDKGISFKYSLCFYNFIHIWYIYTISTSLFYPYNSSCIYPHIQSNSWHLILFVIVTYKYTYSCAHTHMWILHTYTPHIHAHTHTSSFCLVLLEWTDHLELNNLSGIPSLN